MPSSCIISNIVALDIDKIRPKEQKLIELCKEKKAAGDHVLVYCEYTKKLDISERLAKILNDNGVRTTVLDDNTRFNGHKLKINERPDYLESLAADDTNDVVILNPRLVEADVDLLSYTTIVFYEVSDNVTLVRQAGNRSNRLNQEHAVEVYFMYYNNTVQEDLVMLVSQKINAAKAVESDFSESDIQGMNVSSENILTRLAKAFVKNERIQVQNAKIVEAVNKEEDDDNISKLAKSCVESIQRKYTYCTRPVFSFMKPATTEYILNVA